MKNDPDEYLTAKKAYKQTQKAKVNVEEKTLRKILDIIENRSSVGIERYEYDECLNKDLRLKLLERLQQLGFHVSESAISLEISWSEKDLSAKEKEAPCILTRLIAAFNGTGDKPEFYNGDLVFFDYGDGERFDCIGVFVGYHPVTNADAVVMVRTDQRLEIIPSDTMRHYLGGA